MPSALRCCGCLLRLGQNLKVCEGRESKGADGELGSLLLFSVKYGEVAPQAPKIEHLPHKVQSTEFCQGLRQQDTLWGGNISISGDVGFEECFGV